ncbi:MAG: hypothetical protein SOR94_05820 [Lawsonella sp.]|uniref:YqaJ viral recombinase family protein n=1 Tax=Lawsonella sp. TaxID=2041415 RepID=UPI002A7528C2|nr:YqaJ viral recombinase family protein [Lawsonella sp.]MDY2979535.1 hypothetical protein [Lawsonella sp.]
MRIANSSREKNPQRWRDLRRDRITATEIGALYSGKSIPQLYADKHSDNSFDSPYMQWGRYREKKIIQRLMDEIKTVIDSNDDLFSYDDDPFFLSTPDGIGSDFVVEVKTIGRKLDRLEEIEAAGGRATKADFAADNILGYFGQVQTQIFTVPKPLCLFAWEYREKRPGVTIPNHPVENIDDLFTPGEWHFVRVDADDDAIRECKRLGVEYRKYVPSEPPKIPHSLWELQGEIESIERSIAVLQSDLELKKNTLNSIVMMSMEPGSVFEYPLGSVRYTVYTSRGKLDTEKLEEVLPGANAAIKECTRPGKPVTRITVKRRREGE